MSASKPKLSVVITAHNSQDWLEDCINSVEFADEVIVIDNESSDDTAAIAKKLGAVVIPHKNNPSHLNESKNFGFTKAKHEWILSLDTDERVEPELATEIKDVVNSDGDINGYQVPRHNIIFGKIIEHGLWYPDYQVRLFRKGKGKFPDLHNHELLVVEGELGQLQGHIEHHNYQSVSQYLQKIDKTYSDNEVDTFLESGKKIYWYDAIRFPAQDFLSNYFYRQAYKDGLHGLVLSLLQAFYMFIVFAKIWERQGFKPQELELDQVQQELGRSWWDTRFWYAQVKHPGKNIVARVKRKIKIGI